MQRAWELGAAGVGATIYFGSEESRRQIVDIARAFEEAHELGMFTVLWCYLRNSAFKVDGVDYHVAADLTGQANHLGVTIEADIIKQKLPENNGGYTALNQNGNAYGKTHKLVYEQLTQRPPDRSVPLPGRQLLHGPRRPHQLRRRVVGLDATSPRPSTTAVVNKRAGGMGLISGRKAFQRPIEEGAALLNAIQDVYLSPEVTIA